jgi:hypothetical protein
MKKFYSVATAMCLLISVPFTSVFAQNYGPFVGNAVWSANIGQATCTGCTVTINNNTILTVDENVTLVNSIIYVTNNSQLLLKANLTLKNSSIVVGDVSSTSSTANIYISSGDEIVLTDVNSKVRLGNVNNYLSGGTTGTPGEIVAPVTITILGFKITENVAIYTATGSTSGSPYNLNCGGSNPNSCKSGFVYGPAINSQTSIGSGFITFTSLGADSPLPVVLGSFVASLNQNNTVLVSWTTDQEVNSSYFAVQRSSNGSDYTTIGEVGAKGNSATASSYSYTDKSPYNGIDYYRLQMVNLDGSFAYSWPSVVRSELVQNISVFPNPAKNYIYVTLGGSVATNAVRLIDLNGKVLQEQRLNAGSLNTTISLPVSGYAQGIYILQAVKADGTSSSTKVTIVSGQ